MATTYTSKKLAFSSAEQFKESFSEPNPSVGYVFIGNHLPYTNEDSPDSISDTVADEKTVWDNMYAARSITGNDVELVIPRLTWSANNIYRHYDDNVELEYLVSRGFQQYHRLYASLPSALSLAGRLGTTVKSRTGFCAMKDSFRGYHPF